MIEPPLDRLSYYNGQRLDASDLKLEQEYHIRMRRWINKSLYTPGIARGLDVRAETNSRFVVVGPGLALDSEGREILSLEEERVFVPGSARDAMSGTGVAQGLYLTIRYNEEPIQQESGQCVPQNKKGKNGNHAAWGGPAFVRAKPVFVWSEALPYESSGEVVLAQVSLDANCTTAIVNPGVRRYVGAASGAKVRQYALEGARDIDQQQHDSAKIYFHIRGRQPDAVTLYLRAEQFPTYYYTELGNHTHGLGVSGTIGGPVDAASNAKTFTDTETGDPNTAAPTPHQHTDFQASYFGNKEADNNAICLINARDTKGALVVPFPTGDINIDLGQLGQGDLLSRLKTTAAKKNPDFTAVIDGATLHVHNHDHTHAFTFDQNQSGIAHAGILSSPGADPTGYIGRSASPLTYVNDLKVIIDTVDVTQDIVIQLKNADPTWFTLSQDKLGDGTAAHPLATNGSGEIKLDFLPGMSFLEGEHLIELKVSGDGNGGRILYNLYVE